MTNEELNLPQWQKRVQVVKFLYSFLIKQNSVERTKKEAFEDYEFDAAQLKIIEYSLDHFHEIVDLLQSKISHSWQFNRLNYVDQAILIEAYAESQVEHTNKVILIDQSVITAKKYSDDTSYKYINAVLEKVLE